MSDRPPFSVFRDVFLANVRLRSRTAAGKIHTNVSPLKLPLRLQGEVLQAQLDYNLNRTALFLYAASPLTLTIGSYDALFNTWFDSIQGEMLDMPGYERKRVELGLPSGNPRYRIWDVAYDPSNPKPVEIEEHMRAFYNELSQLVTALSTDSHIRTLATTLAFADRKLDQVIHPWLDGCGRMATAVAMWLALHAPKPVLPIFGDRDEHYKCMRTFDTHIEYFMRCLSR